MRAEAVPCRIVKALVSFIFYGNMSTDQRATLQPDILKSSLNMQNNLLKSKFKRKKLVILDLVHNLF